MVTQNTTTKTCGACLEEKPLSEFFADKSKKDGRASSCKVCSSARAKKWAQQNRDRYNQSQRERERARWDEVKAVKKAWRDRNREALNAKGKAWRLENREKQIASIKAWEERNRDHVLERKRAYYLANKESYKAQSRGWWLANPDKKRQYAHNRRAIELGAEGFHSAGDIEKIFALQKGKCANCSAKLGKRYHVDHVVPLSKGGSNWPDNLQLLCRTCNCRKSDKDPYKFANENGRLL